MLQVWAHTHKPTSEHPIRCHVAVSLPEAACNTTYAHLQKPILPLPLGPRCPSCRLETNREHTQPKDVGEKNNNKKKNQCHCDLFLLRFVQKALLVRRFKRQGLTIFKSHLPTYLIYTNLILPTLQFRDHQRRLLFIKRY